MSNALNYKNYYGSVEYSSEDDCFYGKLLAINDLITFEGKSTEELKQSFHEAVDDYLLLCKEQGKEPYKFFKGTFNIRITPELHRSAVIRAGIEGKTLNSIVEAALDTYINH